MSYDQGVQVELRAGHQGCQASLLITCEVVEQRWLVRFVSRLLRDTLLGGALLRPRHLIELSERRRGEEPTGSLM